MLWALLAALAAVAAADADLMSTFEFYPDGLCNTTMNGVSARNISNPAVCQAVPCVNGIVTSCRPPALSSWLTNLTNVIFFVSFQSSNCAGRVYSLQAYPASSPGASLCAATFSTYSCDAEGNVTIQGFADAGCTVPTNVTTERSGCRNGFYVGGCGPASALPNATFLPSPPTVFVIPTAAPSAGAVTRAVIWLLLSLCCLLL